MEINKRLRIAKYGCIVLSVLIGLLGAAMMAIPDFSLPLLYRLGGVLLIAFGCIKLVGYLSRDLYRLAFQFDLAFGILLMTLGLVLLLRSHAPGHIIGILLGILILADSLLKVQTALDSRAFGIRRWWVILTFAVLTALIGLLLLFRPIGDWHITRLLLGLALIGEALLNLATVLTAVQLVQRKNTRLYRDESD